MHQDSQNLLEQCLAKNPAQRVEWENTRKLQNDPRISRVGHIVRISSLDELPQLINVLRGDMSLVGPRPVTAEEIDNYGAHIASYRSVVPGITGLWQVSGRNNTTYPERVALDVDYCANRTFVGDIHILFKTIRVVLTGHGAY
jgi:lipopolysaccharide/colanic/teichoic acid biosynthesis glycosyltransferase